MAREIQYEAEVVIEGITPLLFHKYVLEKTKSKNAETSYEDEWKNTVYINSEGVYIPNLVVKASLKSAAKNNKIGKYFMTKMVPTGIYVEPFEISLFVNKKTVSIQDIEDNNWIFVCPVVVGTSRIVRARSMIPAGWKAKFNLKVCNSLLTQDEVYQLVERAGYDAGLLDWRPERSGDYGQFEVVSFDILGKKSTEVKLPHR